MLTWEHELFYMKTTLKTDDMSQNKADETLEELLEELMVMRTIEERRRAVSKDIKSKKFRYRLIAENDPYQFFNLLGGDDNDVSPTHEWADPWTKKDAIEKAREDGEEEYIREIKKIKKWDLNRISIKRAMDLGYWYDTGLHILKGPGQIKLPFEFEYCEGYLHFNIGTPYNTPLKGKRYGILFNIV